MSKYTVSLTTRLRPLGDGADDARPSSVSVTIDGDDLGMLVDAAVILMRRGFASPAAADPATDPVTPATTAHEGRDDRGGPEEVLDRGEVLRAADCIRRLRRGGEPEP